VANHQVAYLWVPHFGAVVARQAGHGLGRRPLVLFDEQGRVLAVDPEALRAGVAEGMTEHQATARCPQAVFQAASRYPIWEAQTAFLGQVRRFTDRWQPAGLGNAYLDMDGTGMGNGLLSWCQSLAGEVRRLGWEPALGATGSKFGASVIGQVAGENTALLLVPQAQRSFLATQPVTFLPLDPDALTQLRYLGIRTLGQFARLPAAGVLTRFGTAGRTAQHWAQGLDDRPVVPPWEALEVSAQVEFETPLTDRERLLAALMRSAERLLTPLSERFQAVGRITLTVTRADRRIIPAGYTFSQPTAALGPVRLGLEAALARVAWEGQPAASVTLTFGGISDAPVRQLTLLDPAAPFGEETDVIADSRLQLPSSPSGVQGLKATLDRLAARFGSETFRIASLTDPDNLLPERRASWRSFDG